MQKNSETKAADQNKKTSTESEQSYASLENHKVDPYFTGNQGWLKDCVPLTANLVKWWPLILTENVCVVLWETTGIRKGASSIPKALSLQITGPLYNDFDWVIAHVNEVLSGTSFSSTTSRNLCWIMSNNKILLCIGLVKHNFLQCIQPEKPMI